MVFRFLFGAALVAAPLCAQSPGTPPTAAVSAAPSVEAFASLPYVERAYISPDGAHIAGIFASGGEQKIAMMPLLDRKLKTTVIAVPDGMDPGAIRWVNNDNIIVSVTVQKPVEGENWYISRLLGVNRVTGALTKLLWDSNGQNAADVLWVPSDGSNNILVAAQGSIYTNYPEFWPTVYRVDVTNGKKRREQPGRNNMMDWGADHLGQVRIGLGYNDQTMTSKLLYRVSGQGPFKELDKANYKRGQILTVPFMFLPGGDRALVMRDNEEGRTVIVEVDLATLEAVKTIFTPERGEVEGVFMSNDGAAILGVYTSDASKPLIWLDPVLAELQANFDKSVPNSRVAIESMNSDRTKMLVRVDSAETPGSIFYFDTKNGVLQKFAAVNEKLGSKKLAPVKLVRYKARDGLEIEGVLTMPKASKGKNLPLIVMPHGGPWGQDTLTYDYWSQFLASRGYLVLQPNFRGSTGYGTEFLNKGKGQMGLAMQDDVTDGVNWAVEQGMADPKRVCIVGASYGGYAAMWGIAKDPDLYRCAISISGVAALRREVNDFGNSLRGNLYKSQWQEMTPDFNSVSPINAVNRIKAPLLLIHGKKDTTVDHVQSTKMHDAMTDKGKSVELVSLPLADHYFTRQADRVTLLAAMEAFLVKHNPPD